MPRRKTEPAERPLHTLDFWQSTFSQTPQTIECWEMRLVGRDAEGDIFVGPGRIEVRSPTEIRFFIYGAAADSPAAFIKYLKAKERPYEVHEQFRLFATDYRGVEWAGGFTAVDFFTDHTRGWPLSGEIQSLVTQASGPWVSTRSSVELLLVPPIDLPMSQWTETSSFIGDERVALSRRPGRHVLEVLGTVVKFEYPPSGEALWITADTSLQLNHPYAENWLTEPLRILLGVPVYPRMVARNLGDGTAQVWLRPSPRQKRPSGIGLLSPFATELGRTEAFWELYRDLLVFIASAGDWESNELTRLYEELAKSLNGSRWVILLTLASTVEALAKSLMGLIPLRGEFSDADVASMNAHIRQWAGDAALRDRMLSNLAMVSQRSILRFLRDMGDAGTVPKAAVQTWRSLRNSVMHGELVTPWSTEEGDAHIQELIELVHALTRARIAQAHPRTG